MSESIVRIADGLLEEILATAYAPIVAIAELIKNSSDACITPNDVISVYIDASNSLIRIKDNGSGFSSADFDGLREIGVSPKMLKSNQLSKIGEPYAGSKGLGILTAFNLCTKMEINTFSLEDNCCYRMEWEKGSGRISYYEIDENFSGTEVTLHGVSRENMMLITMDEELEKLFSSSIIYYIDSNTLPRIEIYENGIRKYWPQEKKLEKLYHSNRKIIGDRDSGFVAKGMFKYSNNKLTISYEDNFKNLFNISDVELNLTDIYALKSFLFDYGISFKSVESRDIAHIIKNYDADTYLDDFEGVYYIWRERKIAELNYPYGIRVYVNNYGLYNFLNEDNDWLLHSLITQNINASNYKLKNTYGYVNFKNFNESTSGLKISKERNDFTVNLSQKKFLYIMRWLVSGIFSSIDMTVKSKNIARRIFQLRAGIKKLFLGDTLTVNDLISSTMPLKELSIEHGIGITFNNETGEIIANQLGKHSIRFGDGTEWLEAIIQVEDKTPTFELIKEKIIKRQGDSIELISCINKSSMVNVDLEKISIQVKNALVKNNIFSPHNYPGNYVATYTYPLPSGESITRVLQIEIVQLYLRDTNRFEKIFPRYKELTDYIKIKEIIHEISCSYKQNPMVCTIALRSLVEVSIRAFLGGICKESVQERFPVVNGIGWVLDRVHMENSNINIEILSNYRERLARVRKKLIHDYEDLDLNSYVHSCDYMPTYEYVLQSAKIFSLLVNFIIECLIMSQASQK